MKSRLLILVVVLVLGVAGYYYWFHMRAEPVVEVIEPAPEPEPEPAPPPEPEPEPTPEPEPEPQPEPVEDATDAAPADATLPDDAGPQTDLPEPALPDTGEVETELPEPALPETDRDAGMPDTGAVIGEVDSADGEAAMTEALLEDPDAFDAVALRALIDGSNLNEARKAQLRALVDAADGNAALVEGALSAVREALGR